MTHQNPDKIGSLQTIRLLGKGAMAKVYLCRDHRGNEVAVKWLESDHKPWVNRFLKEGDCLKMVQHNHIVQCLGSGMWENRPYLILSYINGWNLKTYAEKLHERPPMERYSRCRQIAVELSQALHALHLMGIIHRDVKPTNILIDENGKSYLTDFGTIKDMTATEQTVTGVMVGTPTYAAPEQLLLGEISDKTDQYGLGATLYYLMSRHRPYETSDRLQSPLALTKHDPNIPADLEAAIFRLMAGDPHDRFANMLEVKDAFSAVHKAGLPLAGRQNLLRAINSILDSVESGEHLVVQPIGIPGSGRQWATKTLLNGASKRQIPAFEVVDAASAESAIARLKNSPSSLLIIDRFGIPNCPIPIQKLKIKPLRLADIRRTIYLLHKEKEDLAKKSLSLFQLTGGIPALLTPLLQKDTTGENAQNPAFKSAIDNSLKGLNYEALELIAAMSLLGAPSPIEEIENISLAPVDELIPELTARGLVKQFGTNHWGLRATALGTEALRLLPEEESLKQRLQIYKSPPPTVDEVKQMLSLADDCIAKGVFQNGWKMSEQANIAAYRHGNPQIVATALFRQGSLMLDLGRFTEASALLSDLSVWTKGHDLLNLKRRSHAMRARCALEMKPGSRESATSAVNRIADVLNDKTDPVISSMWAWAIASLGDERAWKRAAEKAIIDLETVSSKLDRLKWRLYLVRGAFAISDWRMAERLLHNKINTLAAYPCLHWEYQRAACILENTSTPELKDLFPEADASDLNAIVNRWIYIKGISPDLTGKD